MFTGKYFWNSITESFSNKEAISATSTALISNSGIVDKGLSLEIS